VTDDRYLELVGASIVLIASDPSASREPLRTYLGRLTSIGEQNLSAWRNDPSDGKAFHRGHLAGNLRQACEALLAGKQFLARHDLTIGADHIGK